MAAGGIAGHLLALTLCLGALTSTSHGFEILESDSNCSLPGVSCSVLNSNCMDSSWIHPRPWTPAAPSDLEVRLVIGEKESGDHVPVLQIKWTVAPDGNIQ
eukprot:XP_012815542.1 PREDICTED: interleukin-17 receptor A-like [Xenopus tropicalis]